MATAGAVAGRHVVLKVDVAASPGRTMAGRQQLQCRPAAAATVSRTRHRLTAPVVVMAVAAPPRAFVDGMNFPARKTGRPLSNGCGCTWALPVQSRVVLQRCRPRRAFGLSAPTAAVCGVPPRLLSGMRWCARPARRLVKTRRGRARGEARLVVGSRLEMGTVRGGRVDVTQGRGSGQPAPVDFLLWPAHVSVACLALLTMGFAVIPGCFSLFLLCSGSFLLFVRRVVLHGWRSRVRPHVSAASCAAAGAPARSPVGRAGAPAVRARAPAAGASLPLFGVVFAAAAAVLVLAYLLLHGRLHVLVLGHRLRVFLCLCLGWFLRLFLPCSCSCIRCFMGGCTCSCSGTGCGCFSAFVWGGFCGCCCRARARASAASWAVARARARAPAACVPSQSYGQILRLVLPCSCCCTECFWRG